MLLALALATSLLVPQAAPAGAIERWQSLDTAAARRAVAADPAATKKGLDELLARVDASIHSDRKQPEQRRVNFDAEALATGRRISMIFADVTGDRSYARRFRARDQRLTGTKLLNDRRYREALVPLRAALAEARALEDRWLEVITRINLAYGYLELGRGEQALSECEAAVKGAAALDDRARALALFNLGSAHLHLGDADAALRYSEEALALSRTVGIRLWQGNSLLNIGAAYRQQGNLEAARDAFRQALEVLEQTTDRLGVGRALYNMGLVAFSQRDYEASAACLERALPHIRSLDIRHSHEIELDPKEYRNPIELSALQVLIDAYEKAGQPEKAATHMAVLKKLRAQQPRSGGHTHRESR